MGTYTQKGASPHWSVCKKKGGGRLHQPDSRGNLESNQIDVD